MIECSLVSEKTQTAHGPLCAFGHHLIYPIERGLRAPRTALVEERVRRGIDDRHHCETAGIELPRAPPKARRRTAL